MSDNTTINSVVYSTDEIGGVHHERVKIQHGIDGAAVDASATDPLPVTATIPSLPALPTGSNTIGTVNIGTIPAAGVNTDALSAAPVTGAVASMTVSGGTASISTALQPKFVAISAASSGNNTLLAAVTSKKIRVLALYLVVTSAVTVKFQSGASGTDLTGAAALAANGGMVLPFNPSGWFETGLNTLLNLSLGSGVQTSGCLTYVEV